MALIWFRCHSSRRWSPSQSCPSPSHAPSARQCFCKQRGSNFWIHTSSIGVWLHFPGGLFDGFPPLLSRTNVTPFPDNRSLSGDSSALIPPSIHAPSTWSSEASELGEAIQAFVAGGGACAGCPCPRSVLFPPVFHPQALALLYKRPPPRRDGSTEYSILTEPSNPTEVVSIFDCINVDVSLNWIVKVMK